MADPCVACAYRDSIDGDFCVPCMEKRAVEDYLQKDQPVIQKRQERWGGWTQSADAARERQRRHRLLTRTKPSERAHRDSDPLELADSALEHLSYVRAAVKANVRAREHLDQAEELIRQLGWGPEHKSFAPLPSPLAKTPAIDLGSPLFLLLLLRV